MKKIISIILSFFLIFSFALFNKASAAASFPITGPATVVTGQNVTLTISANRSIAYNAVTVNVSFNNFTYVSSSVTGGWTAVAGPTRSGNSVSFTGGLLGSSVTGTRGVLVLTLRAPSSPGAASISVSGTVDGNGVGTGSEGGSGSRSYTVQAAPTPTPTAKPAPSAVTVTSSTHPDQNIWYKATDVSLSWTKAPDVTEFSYTVDQAANTVPDDISEGTEISKTFNNLPEGINYFHIKAKNDVGWSEVSHFAIRIDKTIPDPFTATSVKNSDGSYTLYFASNDNSGESVKFSIKADENDLGVKTSGVIIPAGTKTVTITATDSAGNTTISTYNIENSSITATPTAAKNETSNNTDSKYELNYLGILLIIIASMLLIYGVVITYLYMAEKGIISKIRLSKKSIKEASDSKSNKS